MYIWSSTKIWFLAVVCYFYHRTIFTRLFNKRNIGFRVCTRFGNWWEFLFLLVIIWFFFSWTKQTFVNWNCYWIFLCIWTIFLGIFRVFYSYMASINWSNIIIYSSIYILLFVSEKKPDLILIEIYLNII